MKVNSGNDKKRSFIYSRGRTTTISRLKLIRQCIVNWVSKKLPRKAERAHNRVRPCAKRTIGKRKQEDSGLNHTDYDLSRP